MIAMCCWRRITAARRATRRALVTFRTYQCHPPGFADWSSPEWIVVSGGARDRSEEVTSAYATRGGQVLHTDACGAVQVLIAAGRFEVRSLARADELSAPAPPRPSHPGGRLP